MLKEFKSFVEKHNLIEKDDRILLALSGGVDSMVLAELLLRLQDYKTTRLQEFLVAESDFNGSDLNGSELNGSELNGSKFNGSDLNGSKLNGSELNGSKVFASL